MMNATEARLVIVGAELVTRLTRAAQAMPATIQSARHWSEALAGLSADVATVLVGELPHEERSDTALLQMLQQHPDFALVLLARPEQSARALRLFQQGAFEYLPIDATDAVLSATLVHAIQRTQRERAQPAPEPQSGQSLIGSSAAVQELQRSLQQLAKVSVPVLVRGEPGTGKQVFARQLHQRRGTSGPFVGINIGALPRASLDVELFGLERVQQGESTVVRAGRIEEANGGTLFLNDVADLPLDAQMRLAQLLADGHFHRIGGFSPCPVSVRVIAATRHSLETLVRNGQFQPDLYHRLTVVQVPLPSLQDRRDDITQLVQVFLAQAASELGVESKQVAPEVWPILQQYDWPGNVRQLENLCRRLAVLVPDPVIQAAHLPLEMRPELLIANEARSWEEGLKAWAEQALAAGHRNLLDVAQPVMERILLQAALKHTGGLKQEAALLLGWGRNTLTRKLRELSLETDDDDEAA